MSLDTTATGAKEHGDNLLLDGEESDEWERIVERFMVLYRAHDYLPARELVQSLKQKSPEYYTRLLSQYRRLVKAINLRM